MWKFLLKAALACVVSSVFAVAAYAQTTVTGTVTDQVGQPIVGATVMIKGTTTGTQTNFEGWYSLPVPDAANAVLQISCLGYRSDEMKINNRGVINVILSEDSEMLNELVVVGYGTQKKVNLTGAVSSVNINEMTGGDSRTIFATSSALAGLVPGLQVLQSSGKPGSEGASFRIRGVGSFTSGASSPYVLVDGVEWDIDNLNPADIESISVLKDAASTSIYGTRAANGVILVTTKQGQESKPRISYSFSGVFQRPVMNVDYVSDYATYMELVNECHENMGEANQFSQTNINLWKAAKEDPYGLNAYGVPNYMAYPNTDWFDYVYHTGFSQEHQISISGGSKNIRYLFSGEYTDNQGVVIKVGDINSGSQRAAIRVNLEADVTKWFTLGTKIYGQYRNIGTAATSWIYNCVSTPGMYPGEPGKWGHYANPEDNGDINNPLYGMAATGGYNHYYRLNGTVYAKIRPYKGISIEGTFNYSPYLYQGHTYTNHNVYWDYQRDVMFSETKLEDASVNESTNRDWSVTTDLVARYDATFKKEHVLGIILGYQTKAYKSWGYSVTRKNATDWSMNALSTYSELDSSSSSTPAGWALRGYFARANYAFKDRYLFEANVRVDGSSKFGSDYRYGVFPSFSAGWKIHEEPWMENTSNWLSELKLRASWGQTGNDTGIGNYDWQSTYSTAKVTIDGTEQTGLHTSSASNYNLHWETTSSTDIGLDLGFFNNRLSAGIDYYYRYTRDILYTPSTYITMGYVSSVPANLGNMWNQGVELSLNWKDNAGAFYYYAGVNFSFNKNMVTKFKGKLIRSWDENGNFYTNLTDVAENWGGGLLVEGHPIGDIYYYKLYKGTGAGYSGTGVVDPSAGPKDGMIRTPEDMAWVQAMCDAGYTFFGENVVAKNQIWYGDFIYADMDGDGQFGDSDDRYFPGHTNIPKYDLGITFGLSWKGLDFSMVWSGEMGFNLVWNTVYYNTSNSFQGTYIRTRIANDHYFYDPDNPNDPRTNINGTFNRLQNYINNDQPCDFYDYKGDYLKLKNVTIGYTLPKKWTQTFFCQALRFYFSGENLLTITSYPGYDPEQGTSFAYPIMRQFTIGAQITF